MSSFIRTPNEMIVEAHKRLLMKCIAYFNKKDPDKSADQITPEILRLLRDPSSYYSEILEHMLDVLLAAWFCLSNVCASAEIAVESEKERVHHWAVSIQRIQSTIHGFEKTFPPALKSDLRWKVHTAFQNLNEDAERLNKMKDTVNYLRDSPRSVVVNTTGLCFINDSGNLFHVQLKLARRRAITPVNSSPSTIKRIKRREAPKRTKSARSKITERLYIKIPARSHRVESTGPHVQKSQVEPQDLVDGCGVDDSASENGSAGALLCPSGDITVSTIDFAFEPEQSTCNATYTATLDSSTKTPATDTSLPMDLLQLPPSDTGPFDLLQELARSMDVETPETVSGLAGDDSWWTESVVGVQGQGDNSLEDFLSSVDAPPCTIDDYLLNATRKPILFSPERSVLEVFAASAREQCADNLSANGPSTEAGGGALLAVMQGTDDVDDPAIESKVALDAATVDALLQWHTRKQDASDASGALVVSMACYRTEQVVAKQRRPSAGNLERVLRAVPCTWPQSGEIKITFITDGGRRCLSLSPPVFDCPDSPTIAVPNCCIPFSGINFQHSTPAAGFVFALWLHPPTDLQMQKLRASRERAARRDERWAQVLQGCRLPSWRPNLMQTNAE